MTGRTVHYWISYPWNILTNTGERRQVLEISGIWELQHRVFSLYNYNKFCKDVFAYKYCQQKRLFQLWSFVQNMQDFVIVLNSF